MYQENGKDCMYNCQSSNLHLAIVLITFLCNQIT